MRSGAGDDHGHQCAAGVVKEILVELLERPGGGPGADLARVDPARQGFDAIPGAIPVTLADDEDLRNFVLHVLRLAEDPVRREAVRTGQMRFQLIRDAGRGEQAKAPEEKAVRIDRGALTERTVSEAARSGRSILLGQGHRGNPARPGEGQNTRRSRA